MYGRCLRDLPASDEDHPLDTDIAAAGQVIAALAAGATEKEAADKLRLGAPTLHTHVRRAYDKLDLKSRAELAALLARHGLETNPSQK